MGLNRRQFLVLGGTTVGIGLATLANKFITGAKTVSPSGSSSAPASSSPSTISAAKAAIAPKGLYAPVRGDVRLAVISDLNSAYGSTDYDPEVHKAIELIPGWEPDIVLGGGDMVAGQSPSLTTEQVKAMWQGFDRHIAAPLRKAGLPFGFTIGNHDASAALSAGGNYLFSNERNLAAAYWNDPQHDPGLQFVDRAKFPFYYTFQHKNIFYLIWDASTSRISAEQIAWAEKSLASPAAQNAKLRIAIGHLPLYAVAVGREELGEILADADKLRAMMERYHVHTYISGHHHAYFPGHRGQLELLHTSALGSGPRPLMNSNLAPYKTLTVVDVNLSSASTVYTTYNMQTLEVVDQRKLPRLIVGPNGMVVRRDIQESELTAEEKSMTFNPNL